MTGGNSTGGMNGMGPGAQSHDDEQKPTFNGSVTWVKNNHTFKFGGGEGRTEGYIQHAYQGDSGTFTIARRCHLEPVVFRRRRDFDGWRYGISVCQFPTGQGVDGGAGCAGGTRGGRKSGVAGFVQIWKATRTLYHRLRFAVDYFTHPRTVRPHCQLLADCCERHSGRPSGEAPSSKATNPACANCSFGHNYPFAFGPRVGLAYQINGKTVLRAGTGVTYSSSSGVQGANGASQTATASAG